MSYVERELNRMRHDAWNELYTDVARSGNHIRHLGLHYITRHPALIAGAGALLGALMVSRFSQPAPPCIERKPRKQHRLLRSTIGMLARGWLMDALSPGAPDEQGVDAASVED